MVYIISCARIVSRACICNYCYSFLSSGKKTGAGYKKTALPHGRAVFCSSELCLDTHCVAKTPFILVKSGLRNKSKNGGRISWSAKIMNRKTLLVIFFLFYIWFFKYIKVMYINYWGK